jgi:hypothetical protein
MTGVQHVAEMLRTLTLRPAYDFIRDLRFSATAALPTLGFTTATPVHVAGDRV